MCETKTDNSETPTPVEIPACHNGFLYGTADCGTGFYKVILCGKEYCPDCGEKESWVHLRRYYRWLSKGKFLLYKNNHVGHTVMTVPFECRQLFLGEGGKEMLSAFRRECKYLLKYYAGLTHALVRFHWQGDCKECKGSGCENCSGTGVTPGYHPHLHILSNLGKINQNTLQIIREKLQQFFFEYCNYTGPVYFWHGYSKKYSKLLHWLIYNTRATFRNYRVDIAEVVYRYPTTSTWGNFEGHEKYSSEIEMIDKGVCPCCQGAITWHDFLKKSDFAWPDWQEVGAGFFVAPPKN